MHDEEIEMFYANMCHEIGRDTMIESLSDMRCARTGANLAHIKRWMGQWDGKLCNLPPGDREDTRDALLGMISHGLTTNDTLIRDLIRAAMPPEFH